LGRLIAFGGRGGGFVRSASIAGKKASAEGEGPLGRKAAHGFTGLFPTGKEIGRKG